MTTINRIVVFPTHSTQSVLNILSVSPFPPPPKSAFCFPIDHCQMYLRSIHFANRYPQISRAFWQDHSRGFFFFFFPGKPLTGTIAPCFLLL